MDETTFAITYTVKNESRLLPSAIDYHLALGCSMIYVFLDGTTDGTDELIRGNDKVQVFSSIKPDDDEDLPSWIGEIMPHWETNMDVRKRINTYYASVMARNEGIGWIGCIDPDELLVVGLDKPVSSDVVARFFGDIPSTIDQILFRNLEVIPTATEVDNPFEECTVFLNRFPITELFWRFSCAAVRRVGNPKLLAWYDHWFYKLRFLGALPRLMVSPVDGRKIPASYFLGYSNHKAFMRTGRFSQFNFVIHFWRKHIRRPKSIYRGHVLHYDLFDYKYLLLKFNQRPVLPYQFKPFYVRDAIETVAREATDECVKDFFGKYVAILDEKRLNELQRRKIAVRVTSISEFFSERKVQ